MTIAHPFPRVLGQQQPRAARRSRRRSRAGAIHGLMSCSEWTGVPLRVLLEEAGVDAAARTGCSPKARIPRT